MKMFKFGSAAMLAGAGAVALTAMAPATASAQSYRYTPSYGSSYGTAYDQQGQYYYDGCERSENNRAIAGGVIGAVAGAAIGNNTGSRRRNDENALIGGILGAVAGASIGKSTAACSPPNNNYGRNTYSSYGYGYGQPTYGSSYGYPNSGYGYGNYNYGYGNDGYAYGYGDNRGGYGYNQPNYNQYGQQCTYVEDSIRLPDGRTERRMVQACRDSSGRYRVVQ